MKLKYIIPAFTFSFLFLPTLTLASPSIQEANILVITDVHLNQQSKHTMEVSPSKQTAKNDLDLPTFKQLILKTKDTIDHGTIKKPSAIMILGDIQGHLRTSPKSIAENEATVFRVLHQTFPDTPMFYTFGNNDSLQSNYGPFTLKKATKEYTGEKNPFDVAIKQGGWKNGFLSTGVLCEQEKSTYPCLIKEDKEHGYYSAYIEPNLRFISLNSVAFSIHRKDVSKHEVNEQLHWLKKQLKQAKQEQDAVLLAMHIPPGRNVYNHEAFWKPKNSKTFLTLLNAYQSNIIGILTAHTHQEEIKLVQNQAGETLFKAYSTAALSTVYGNAPSVKTFEFSNKQHHWRLDDYETFNVVKSDAELHVKSLYRFSEYYGNNKPITANNMKYYFSAGNKNFQGIMKSPEDMIIVLPK